MAENALRQSLIMSQGSVAIFLTRPISGVITAVAIFFFVMPILTPWWRKLRGAIFPGDRPFCTRLLIYTYVAIHLTLFLRPQGTAESAFFGYDFTGDIKIKPA